MLEQESRKRLRILSHCIAARVLIWEPSSSHDHLRRWIHMILESILYALSDPQQKLLPIVGEVDKLQNRKGENNHTLYRTVQPLAYLLGSLLVHKIVFAVRCICSWNKLLMLYEICIRNFCLLQERQTNVRIVRQKTIAHYITLYSCGYTYLADFQCTRSSSPSDVVALGINYHFFMISGLEVVAYCRRCI